ncbi:unnamed protein product [Vitrella brassicaformis CCMP3155]|uniref:Prenylcysteine lyase domain-containing protein n=3 Tax=Vitrella brassicaformis TaxID=1169539 RepID=A0A0G4G770_VITBC|nr:unnamed protein product [Vitrella brassicaformis CCMP3155]|eukprot:CEM24373.1 unnamed protein product [Vitrella brassicaformis CCMP3155]
MTSSRNIKICLLFVWAFIVLAARGEKWSPAPGKKRRLAIFGGGIAGTFTSYFVDQLLKEEGRRDEWLIDLYEKESVLGGRVREVEVEGLRVEAGAGILHSSNEFMQEAVDFLNLTATTPSADGRVYIWDGTSILWHSYSNSIVTLFSILWRYGLATLFHASQTVNRTLKKWTPLYKSFRQRAFPCADGEAECFGGGFASPKGLFEGLALYDETQVTAGEFLRRKRLKPLFMDEWVEGISRVNYGQSLSTLNAFANQVSLAGGSLVGSVWRVKEGNSRVPEGLARHSADRVLLGRAVRSVSLIEPFSGHPPLFAVHAASATAAGGANDSSLSAISDAHYDAVVLAAPMGLSGISLDDSIPIVEEAVEEPLKYQTTYATFVACDGVDKKYFSMKHDEPVDLIFTPEIASLPITSIGLQGYTPTDKRHVYKVFSRTPPPDSLLKEMFVNISTITRVDWLAAYPILRPMAHWPHFRFRRGMYYVSAMEAPVSCMESEAVGARNVAHLFMTDFVARGAGDAADADRQDGQKGHDEL